MGLVARVAASFNLIAGAWAAVLFWTLQARCPPGGCPSPLLQSMLPIIGVLLVLDALLCFVGFRLAFPLGGVLSVLITAITLFGWAAQTSGEYASLALVSLVALVFDLVAMRSKRGLSEQGNPMNLPVFG